MNNTYTKIVDYLNQNVFEEDDYYNISELIYKFDMDINRLKEFKTMTNNEIIIDFIEQLIYDYHDQYFTCDGCKLVRCHGGMPPCDYCDFAYCDNCSTMTFRTRPCYRDNCVDCEQEQCYFLRPERICSYCLGHKHP